MGCRKLTYWNKAEVKVLTNGKTEKNACCRYELTNHLSNVLSVVTDRRTGVCGTDTSAGGDTLVAFYNADIISATDYYPFGMQQPDRKFSSGGYRFGFNGKEKLNHLQGEGNAYDFGARIYDARLGRWLSVDPLASKFPWYSPYLFSGNKPIWFVDIDGKFEYPKNKAKEYTKSYPMLTKYLSENVENDVMSSPIIMKALLKFSGGNLTKEEVQKAVQWDSGPQIVFTDNLMYDIDEETGVGIYAHTNIKWNSLHTKKTVTIYISSEFAKNVESILAGNGSKEEKKAALYEFFATLTHETVHHGDMLDDTEMRYQSNASWAGEPGSQFISDVFESKTMNIDGGNIRVNQGSVHDKPKKLMNIQENEGRSEVLPTLPEDNEQTK